jgi:E-phenylitaconyl-CoA hydratase
VSYETIDYRKVGRVAIITLNRPERLNTINGQMYRELPPVWEEFDQDPDVWVGIVTGAGERAFCAGADVKEIAELGRPNYEEDRIGDLSAVSFTPRRMGVRKPVITAVNGVCVGGGLLFVADGDFAICSENATFSDAHSSVGLVGGETVTLMRRSMPHQAALRMQLMGKHERIDARRALEIGMVTQVVPLAELMPTTMDIAQTICRNSPAAIIASKRSLWQALEMGHQEVLDAGWKLAKEHWAHPDYREGPSAFVEKREPQWLPPATGPRWPSERDRLPRSVTAPAAGGLPKSG